jgi:hypothetical protein
VGHEHRGDAEALLRGADLVAHPVAQPGVQVAQRLVQQQHLRFAHQRPGQRDPLLLSAGEHRRRAGGEVRESDPVQRRQRPFARLRLGGARMLGPQREHHVLQHGHVRPDRVGLEDDADGAMVGAEEDALAGGGHHGAVDGDLAAVRALQAGDEPQGRGLAAAAGAEQGDQLALGDLDVDAVDRVAARRAARVPLDHVGDLDHCASPSAAG